MDKISNAPILGKLSNVICGKKGWDRFSTRDSFARELNLASLFTLSNSSKASLNSALSSSSRLLVISASDHLDRPPILTNTTSQVHYMGSSILARLCFAGRQCWAEVDIFTSAAGNTRLDLPPRPAPWGLVCGETGPCHGVPQKLCDMREVNPLLLSCS